MEHTVKVGHCRRSFVGCSFQSLTIPGLQYFCVIGGAKGSTFYTKRFSAGSGLNSTNLDFLPVRNVEESVDVAIGGVMAAVPVGKYMPAASLSQEQDALHSLTDQLSDLPRNDIRGSQQ